MSRAIILDYLKHSVKFITNRIVIGLLFLSRIVLQFPEKILIFKKIIQPNSLYPLSHRAARGSQELRCLSYTLYSLISFN